METKVRVDFESLSSLASGLSVDPCASATKTLACFRNGTAGKTQVFHTQRITGWSMTPLCLGPIRLLSRRAAALVPRDGIRLAARQGRAFLSQAGGTTSAVPVASISIAWDRKTSAWEDMTRSFITKIAMKYGVFPG